MSDLPELNLFEEIQGIANSSDFYAYTQDEFNKTWSYYEDEMDYPGKELKEGNSLWSSPVRNSVPPTPPSSGKSSPTRDAWDPMLWHTRSLEEVELRALASLSPPTSPVVLPSLSQSISAGLCPCQGVYQAPTTSLSLAKGQDQAVRRIGQLRESSGGRGRPGESRHRKKAR